MCVEPSLRTDGAFGIVLCVGFANVGPAHLTLHLPHVTKSLSRPPQQHRHGLSCQETLTTGKPPPNHSRRLSFCFDCSKNANQQKTEGMGAIRRGHGGRERADNGDTTLPLRAAARNAVNGEHCCWSGPGRTRQWGAPPHTEVERLQPEHVTSVRGPCVGGSVNRERKRRTECSRWRRGGVRGQYVEHFWPQETKRALPVEGGVWRRWWWQR